MTDMLPVMVWMIAEKMAQNEFAASCNRLETLGSYRPRSAESPRYVVPQMATKNGQEKHAPHLSGV